MPSPPARWSLRSPPPFIEAYPTLSVGEVARQLAEDRDHLIWRDRYEHVVGIARAEWLDPEHLAIRHRIEEQPYYDSQSGELTLPVTWKGSAENNKRPFTQCPLCQRSVDILVFAGSWHCSSPHHGLRYRSAGLSQVVRWSEKLAEVEGMLAVDQVLGATGKKHLKRAIEREALLVNLRHRSLEANSLQLVIISREWVRPVAARQT